MRQYSAAILMGLLGAAFVCAAETWTIAFKDKTESAITGYATGTDAPTVESVALSGETTTTFKTSGNVADDATLFTPNTNVQLTASNANNPYFGWWKGAITFTATSSQKLSKISVSLFSFDKDGNAQGDGTNRALTLSASINGLTLSGDFTINGTGSLNTTACEFTPETPMLLVGGTSYTLEITAKRSTQTDGSYFGMASVAATVLVPEVCESATIPRGYVVKTLPAGTSVYVAANVQKPILTAGTGAFVAGDAGISLTADAGMNFSDFLASGKAYLLEVDFEEGTAIALLNSQNWIDGVDAWTIAGNVLAFADAPLATLIAAAGTGAEDLPFRLREAWTLDELFGASYEAGELKRGTALTGDAIFLYAADAQTPIKFYNHKTKGWCAVGVKAATAQAKNAPVHPHKPLRITRKKGADLELCLPGEALPGDALIAVSDTVDVVAPGDAFAQTLANSELERSLGSVTVAGTRYVFDAVTQTWKAEDGGTAEDPSLENVFEAERDEATASHIRVRGVR